MDERVAPLRIWTARNATAAWVMVVSAGLGTPLLRRDADTWAPFVAAVIGTTTVCVLGAWWIMARREHLRQRVILEGIAVTLAAFVAWYVMAEPLYGPTSDNAEALELGVQQLTHGASPWAVATRFGNPLSPMLGGYLIAAPFVVLTGSVYAQQLVCMAVLVVVLVRTAGPHATLAVTVLFVTSHHTRLWVPNQSDNWITAVGVLLSSWWGLAALRSERHLARWLSAAAFGIALSYRFTLWIAVVPVGVMFVREFGVRRALSWMSVAGLVTVTLSFGPLITDAPAYLAGPFAAGYGKAADTGVPGAPFIVAIPALMMLAWRSAHVRDWADVWMTVACTLATMIGMLVVIRLPDGLEAALASYETVAYNGAWMILGLVSLALPRQPNRLEQWAPPKRSIATHDRC